MRKVDIGLTLKCLSNDGQSLSVHERPFLSLSLAVLLCFSPALLYAQQKNSVDLKRSAEAAKVKSAFEGLYVSIQNVDISRFPTVKLIIEVFDDSARVLESVDPRELTVVENGVPKQVLSIEKINITEHVPVDFMFVIDVTGTMQPHINGIRTNIKSFVESLRNRGIEYRIGLILFSDIVEQVHEPTSDVDVFLGWLAKVFASGGYDTKENALEAVKDATKIRWNPSANRVAVLITDAPYHQMGERGNGRTFFTTETAIDMLRETSVRLFAIVPPELENYRQIAESSRGAVYDIRQSFATILDQYSSRLTNLYALSYRSDKKIPGDSINVSILDDQKQELVKKVIPIVEVGRKFIIENLLFQTSSAMLADSVEELEVLIDFMKSRPNVKVRVEGHSDSRGNPKSNKVLSLARADAVKLYLIAKGMDPERITTMGYGSARPIGDNATEFGRSLNRRTEIVITAK